MNGSDEVKVSLRILLNIVEDEILEMKLRKETIKVIIRVMNYYLLFILQVILITFTSYNLNIC